MSTFSKYTNQISDGRTSRAIYNMANNNSIDKKYLNVALADASSASSCYLVLPGAGKITKISSVISASLTAAAAVITPLIGASGATGTSLTSNKITIAAESPIATVDSTSPTGAESNSFTDGQILTLTTDGGSTNTSIVEFLVECTYDN